jgi:hypothetical protein
MQVDGLAVTPGGQDGFVVGNYSESLSGLVDSRPFLAKYSASTGAFLKGYNFDRDETRLGVGVAVDPTGQHVYVGDERNPFVGRTTARVYEVDVSRLHEARRFRLAGNDLCCDLAITPDGHLFAQVGPPHSTQVLFQEYSSSAGATFACRLALVGSPPPAFKTCPSPVTYVQLSDGTCTASSFATMTFSGRSIAVIAPVGPAYGSIQICLDPGVSVAGCTTTMPHSTTAVARDTVYVSGPLAAGPQPSRSPTQAVRRSRSTASSCSADDLAGSGRRPSRWLRSATYS